MSNDASTAEVASISNIMGVARESLVLLTVVVIVAVAWFLWSRVLGPFMETQSKIAATQGEALNSIRATADALRYTTQATEITAKQQSEISRNLAETAKQQADTSHELAKVSANLSETTRSLAVVTAQLAAIKG